MFFGASVCMVSPKRPTESSPHAFRKSHMAAFGVDTLIAIALLVIGILATQLNFLPSHVGYAFIGAGAAYSCALLAILGTLIKLIRLPRTYLIH
jgi:hypothetical protein